jgi:hypothetical protein
MIGAICTSDIVAHPVVTIRCFGWQVFFKALAAGRDQTFLSLLAQNDAMRPAAVRIPRLVDRCVRLERQAKGVYQAMAGRFLGHQPVAAFLDALADQEEGHAQLLELCREAAGRAVWQEEHFAPWRDAVPRLEEEMDRIQASLSQLDRVADALWLVIQIEGSEVNRVFQGIVDAAASDFVRRLGTFATAGDRHIRYICQTISRLDPELAEPCRELEATHFAGRK